MCVIFSIAILAPFLAPYDPNLQLDVINKRLLPPSPRFPLGTDELSRDLLSRIIYGSRISISIGLLSAAIAIFLGTLVGLISGYMAGKTDVVLMRLVDILLGFPRFFLILLVIAFFKPSIFIIVIVLSLVSWMEVSRLVRAQVLSLKEQEFVTAAKSMGIGAGRIIFAHILPNTVAPVIIAGALRVGSTILLEASLSFLGLGVQPPTASWGNIVNSGSLHLTDAWWISTFSGIAIIFTVVSFNLVGDGLRDIMDPRLRIRGDI
ncbi:MAG: ABC transporter permease [Fidelibacterota bacterium]